MYLKPNHIVLGKHNRLKAREGQKRPRFKKPNSCGAERAIPRCATYEFHPRIMSWLHTIDSIEFCSPRWDMRLNYAKEVKSAPFAPGILWPFWRPKRDQSQQQWLELETISSADSVMLYAFWRRPKQSSPTLREGHRVLTVHIPA